MKQLTRLLTNTLQQTTILDLECLTLRESIARIDGMIAATREVRKELERQPSQAVQA